MILGFIIGGIAIGISGLIFSIGWKTIEKIEQESNKK